MSAAVQASTVSLDSLPIGSRATIVEIDITNPEIIDRLMIMGVAEGDMVTILQKGPFGCPIAVGFPGFTLALRSIEAARVQVSLAE